MLRALGPRHLPVPRRDLCHTTKFSSVLTFFVSVRGKRFLENETVKSCKRQSLHQAFEVITIVFPKVLQLRGLHCSRI